MPVAAANATDAPEVEQPPQHAHFQTLTYATSSHERPDGAPAALAYWPANFDPTATYEVVLFAHGWRGCVRLLAMEGEVACLPPDQVSEQAPSRSRRRAHADSPTPSLGWGLGPRLGAPNRIVLFPQLAYRQRDGRSGHFRDPAFAAAWWADTVSQLQAHGAEGRPEHVTVMAHSAGFQSTLALLESLPVDAVLLMDALYAGTQAFANWVAVEPERLLFSTTTGGETGRQQRRLARITRRLDLLASDSSRRVLPTGEGPPDTRPRVWLSRSRARHADIPFEEGPGLLNQLAELRASYAERDTPGGLNAN